MFKILKYLRARNWQLALIALLLIASQVWLDLKLPEYMGVITQLVQTPGTTPGQVWSTGIAMLLCALGSLVSGILIGYFMAIISTSFSMRLRERLFDKTFLSQRRK